MSKRYPPSMVERVKSEVVLPVRRKNLFKDARKILGLGGTVWTFK